MLKPRNNFFINCIPLREYIPEWLSIQENLLFVLLIVVHLIPLWVFKHFPSQDGHAHVYNASVLREYYFADRSAFRDYYVLNPNPVPNWFSHLFMAGLMYIVPPFVAEKILLSGYVILLPFSMRYALRTIRPDTGFLAFLVFPFIYNYLFHLGFYNFSYSLPMFFFVVGYWLKYQNQFTLSKIVTLSLLSLLLYFCHIFSLMTTYIAIAILIVWLTVLNFAQQLRQQQFNLQSLGQAFCRRTLMPLCAFLPTIILVVMFLGRKSTTSSEPSVWRLPGKKPLFKLLLNLLHLQSLVSYESIELYLSTILAIVFVAISLYFLGSKVVHRQLNCWDGLLLCVAAYVVIYFVGPSKMAGTVTFKERLMLYPFFILILWFGAQSYNRLVKYKIQIIAVVISLILLGVHTRKYAELNNYLEEYVAGMHLIEPNTTLLPISFSNVGHTPEGRVLARPVKPFCHASNYIATQKHVVDLANYEANKDYFPTMFRAHLNPFVHINIPDSCDGLPPPVDFLTYPQRTLGKVDYVLLWQLRKKYLNHENTQSILRQLEEGYKLIYTSPQRGFMQLYRRKD